jgi:hypothetical protein
MAGVDSLYLRFIKKNLNGFVVASLVSGVRRRRLWLWIASHRVQLVRPFLLDKRDGLFADISAIPGI